MTTIHDLIKREMTDLDRAALRRTETEMLGTLVHISSRIDNAVHPGFATTTEYRALCGYTSPNRNEFRKDSQELSIVTCEACIAKLGKVVEPVVQWRVK